MTEHYLQGFGEVRDVQATIAHTYENDVLKPAKEMAGLYAIVERHRPARGAAAALARQVARGVHRQPGRRQRLLPVARHRRRRRRNIATVEQTIPVMIDLAENTCSARRCRAGAARRGVPRGPQKPHRAVRGAPPSC